MDRIEFPLGTAIVHALPGRWSVERSGADSLGSVILMRTIGILFAILALNVASVMAGTVESGTPRVIVSPQDGASTGVVKWQELRANGANYVELKSPAALGVDLSFTWPSANAGGLMKVTSGGVMSIGAASIGEGGTGQVTQTAAFDALSPLTTMGDLLTHNGTNNIRLLRGNALYYLRTNAAATALEWAAFPSYEVPLTFSGGVTRVGNNITVDTAQNIARSGRANGRGAAGRTHCAEG